MQPGSKPDIRRSMQVGAQLNVVFASVDHDVAEDIVARPLGDAAFDRFEMAVSAAIVVVLRVSDKDAGAGGRR